MLAYCFPLAWPCSWGLVEVGGRPETRYPDLLGIQVSVPAEWPSILSVPGPSCLAVYGREAEDPASHLQFSGSGPTAFQPHNQELGRRSRPPAGDVLSLGRAQDLALTAPLSPGVVVQIEWGENPLWVPGGSCLLKPTAGSSHLARREVP